MDRRTQQKLRQDDLETYLDEPGDYPDRTTTVSATECTGLFPVPPQNDAEYRSLQQMHGMGIPRMAPSDGKES